jgi:flavin reductase (DIM6/NTAB) family NADH-FMN oxidoreductase RutF
VTIDSAQYRDIVGRFATGVTVVTTYNEGLYHGFTANAVTSVSLDPLLLLVCVEKTARAHEELVKANAFVVNILTREQEDLSNLFAKRREPVAESLRGVPLRPGMTGAPIIGAALAYLECETAERLDGGDHTIFLGRVVAGEGSNDGSPLLYYNGKYRTIAD